jgi:hypothetical protein
VIQYPSDSAPVAVRNRLHLDQNQRINDVPRGRPLSVLWWRSERASGWFGCDAVGQFSGGVAEDTDKQVLEFSLVMALRAPSDVHIGGKFADVSGVSPI